jgi:hypothetical protein
VDEAARAAKVLPADGHELREDVADDLACIFGYQDEAVRLREMRDEEAAVAGLGMIREQESARVGRVMLAH